MMSGKQMALCVGDQVPEVSLLNQHGKPCQLSGFQGKKVLLYFYPKDDTPGCTTEACTLRDSFKEFQKAGIIILGISTDTVKSHERFVKKYELPFMLLADENKEVVKAYGVWGKKKFMGREYLGTKRMSFLIDEQGRIIKLYENVKPKEHAKEVLGDVLKKDSPIFEGVDHLFWRPKNPPVRESAHQASGFSQR